MAFISKELIDEVKSKNDIVDIIGSYISLNDKNKALCPFHNDHSPSFSVHPDKQIYKCFSCGESGNVITFVEKFLGISFQEAVKLLADRAGIKLNINVAKKTNKYDKYYEITDTVNKYFKNNIFSSNGQQALKYLNDRHIDKDIINEFNIGISTNNKLHEILAKKYNLEDLLKIDIVREVDNKIYDTFQNRIMFPIIDEDNNIVGFSGRKYLANDLDNKQLSKYVNSRETDIFIKSKIFYNINNALPNIKKSKEIIITEGFMDTIRMVSIGYNNTVALMGTAFTKEHLDKIIKYKCRVVLNLDQDNAGVLGTISIGDELIKNNIDVSVIVFDDYKDSDEYIINKGKEAFDYAYKNRISYIDFKFKYLKSNKNMKDSTDISKYINEAIKSLNDIDDDILKELKINELSHEFGIDESVIKNKIKLSGKKEVKKEEKITKKRYDKYDISEIRILYLMLNYDDVILYFENSLGYLIHDNMMALAYKIVEFRNDYGYFNYSDFIDYVGDNELIKETIKEIMRYHNDEEYTESELEDYFDTIKEYSVKKRINELKKEMNETLDVNKKIELANKINKINKEVLQW
ncbi:dNA primase [Clostridium sp. CAG:1000]|nr:dNA primase [Clostridium sp. CAG:1000]